jgi:hypothetical protein
VVEKQVDFALLRWDVDVLNHSPRIHPANTFQAQTGLIISKGYAFA